MANVTLPANQFVDLYAAVGSSPGNQLRVTCISPNDVSLYTTASTPDPSSDDRFPCTWRGAAILNSVTDAGAWAICQGGGAVDVEVL
jgi:hypothetical protein